MNENKRAAMQPKPKERADAVLWELNDVYKAFSEHAADCEDHLNGICAESEIKALSYCRKQIEALCNELVASIKTIEAVYSV